MEYHNGAIFHAADYLLKKLDDAQQSFLHKLEVAENTTFLEQNFAPPSLRRDIGILGLLHKRVLGKAHPVFSVLLPFSADANHAPPPGSHNKSLYGHEMEASFQLALFFRSIFSMVFVYNRLPQAVVDSPSVAAFQRHLTRMARERCQNGDSQWKRCFVRRL